MKWNAFDLLTPAYKKTKERLFPIKFWEWIKLAFVSLFSYSFSGGSGPNFNYPSSNNNKKNRFTGNVVGKFRQRFIS